MFLRILGSIFLVSGTAIGAGMLGLPIKILGINFYFNFFIFLIVWLIMLISAIAMLEIAFWSKENSNIIIISDKIFGFKFGFIFLLFYLMFLYSLISAYISGGSSVLNDILLIKLNLNKNLYISKLFFILPFCIITFLGIKFIDNINKIFVSLLILSYLIIVFLISDLSTYEINDYYFFDKKNILLSISVMITSFGYSLLIPSLKDYLNKNTKIIIYVIFIGSIIPFVIYIIWEYLIIKYFLNIGNKLCIQTLFSEGNPTEKLILLLSNNDPFVFFSILLFSFFSIASSFIGVSLGMYDSFFDILKIEKEKTKNKIYVLFFVFCIPLIFNIIFPYGFMIALSYAGIFASILLILFPIYTLWYGRYIKKLNYKYLLFDNKYFLYFIFSFGLSIIFLEITEKFLI